MRLRERQAQRRVFLTGKKVARCERGGRVEVDLLTLQELFTTPEALNT